ncbi:MAG TPA: hypothetical protein VK789_07760 [Bryobacteraceae bacterium]|nr:hypothetical protein [Bryobacteraceae bacterium]
MGYGLFHIRMGIFASALLWLSTANATTVPGLSFEELTDQSDLIVSGQINRSWTDWDSEHKYIWTHYALTVSSALKGIAGATVDVSEPGGVVGNQGMNIAGAPAYQTGEQVLVFLHRMPNGFLRTTGWTQGKYTVDRAGLLHAAGSSIGLDVVGSAAGRIRSLEGMNVAQVRGLVAARIRTQPQGRAQ